MPFLLIVCGLASLASLAIGTALADDAPTVKLIQREKVIDVEIGGRPFTTYHFADDFIQPYTRPFFWPVRAADGTEVTIDQAQFKELHPHQRSIWIGHSSVNGANHWKITTKPVQPKQRSMAPIKASGDTIEHELAWEDKAGQPMLTEVRTMRFIAYADGARAIDFTLRFTPISGDVTFYDGKDAGLLAIRLVPAIAGDPLLINSAGGTGNKGCSGKPAAWCDESGRINGQLYGAAILDSPNNARHPPPWHAHTDAHLGTDIFGLHAKDKDNKYPKGAGDFTIKLGQTVTFRYRLIIHTGDAAAAKITEKFSDFVVGK
jgi:hypothetical protein